MAKKQSDETVAKKKTQAANGGRSGSKASDRSRQTEEDKRSRLPEEPQEDSVSAFAFRTGYGREIGAFVCLFLAVFSILGLFGVKALFIDLLCGLIKGLIGYGFYLMIPALLLCMLILFRHNGKPVAFRVGCVLLTPAAFGGMLHVMISKAEIDWGFSMLKTLFTTGRSMESGGLISGFIAMLLKLIFSGIGAGILLTVAFLLLLLASFRITVISVTKAIQNRPRPEGRDPDMEQSDPATVIVNRVAQRHIDAAERRKTAKTDISDFDLPVDDPGQSETATKAGKAAIRAGRGKRPDSKEELQQQIARSLQEPEPVKTIRPDYEPEFMKRARAEKTEPQPEPDLLPVKTKAAARAQAIQAEQTAPERLNDSAEHGASMAPAVDALAREEQLSADQTPPWETAQTVQPPVTPNQQAGPSDEDRSAEQTQTDSAGQEGPEAADEAPESAENQPEIVLNGQEVKIIEHPYSYPPFALLGEVPDGGVDGTEEMKANALRLADTLQSFGIDATIMNVTRGPAVTRYELELDRGVKLSKLTNLADDIALALGASGVRISAIPDRISVVGVEVPNKVIRTVYAREVLESQEFQTHKSKVAFAVGVNISGEKIVGDISKLPHMLIAGTTGSGKSVCINTLIISLLYRASPEEVRMIMIDPKMIELGVYNGIPHLLIPVVTDAKKASGALQWAVTEMMRRYQLLADEGVRDLEAYNAAMEKRGQEKLPKIVIVIDELADLMMVAAKEVEESICRIAQLARAAGMHLVIATQRPSADVITGIMKANVPSRIAFAVASQMESRIILDAGGAEKLVGKGDMLYAPIGAGKPQRVQGCFISDEEVEDIVAYIKTTGNSDYSADILEQIEQKAAEQSAKNSASASAGAQEPETEGDELLPQAVEVILETGQASVSMLQRRLKLGYARAARIVDEMEERGIVGPFEGSKPRQLLITRDQWQQMQGGEVGAFFQAQELQRMDDE